MEKLAFDRIIEGTFSADTFSVTEKTVFPPEAFVCQSGMVLRERFFYIVKGKIFFDDGTGQEKIFKTGDIVYLPYNVTYRSRWDTAENGKYLSVGFILRDENNSIISFSDSISLLLSDRKKEFLTLFSDLRKVWATGSYGYKLEMRSKFYEILYRLSVNAEYSSLKSSRNTVYRAIFYLENNYLSDVTASELADMINVKECMFRRAFKAEKGMSPVKYRNMLRLKKAYEMLSSGEYSVVETAISTNFDDPGYFSKLFKRQYGISPSECIPKQT
ncbi:MAG: AraC family transcriptional regulator [Ruminococcaceae bacterium]|nr:AraC family transcriptional regulator [Oscillospiraceae bacterium]